MLQSGKLLIDIKLSDLFTPKYIAVPVIDLVDEPANNIKVFNKSLTKSTGLIKLNQVTICATSTGLDIEGPSEIFCKTDIKSVSRLIISKDEIIDFRNKVFSRLKVGEEQLTNTEYLNILLNRNFYTSDEDFFNYYSTVFDLAPNGFIGSYEYLELGLINHLLSCIFYKKCSNIVGINFINDLPHEIDSLYTLKYSIPKEEKLNNYTFQLINTENNTISIVCTEYYSYITLKNLSSRYHKIVTEYLYDYTNIAYIESSPNDIFKIDSCHIPKLLDKIVNKDFTIDGIVGYNVDRTHIELLDNISNIQKENYEDQTNVSVFSIPTLSYSNVALFIPELLYNIYHERLRTQDSMHLYDALYTQNRLPNKSFHRSSNRKRCLALFNFSCNSFRYMINKDSYNKPEILDQLKVLHDESLSFDINTIEKSMFSYDGYKSEIQQSVECLHLEEFIEFEKLKKLTNKRYKETLGLEVSNIELWGSPFYIKFIESIYEFHAVLNYTVRLFVTSPQYIQRYVLETVMNHKNGALLNIANKESFIGRVPEFDNKPISAIELDKVHNWSIVIKIVAHYIMISANTPIHTLRIEKDEPSYPKAKRIITPNNFISFQREIL